MRYLWLFCFPLLFLPNLGLSHPTPYGVLEISDWLIGVLILLLLVAPTAVYQQTHSKLVWLLLVFLLWASLTILSIPFRYQYTNDIPLLAGCFLKLARLALYVMASVLIFGRLASPRVRGQWLW